MPSAQTEAPAWLTEDQQQSWMAVAGMLMTLPAALDAQLRADSRLNLFEYHVLVALADAPGRTVGMSDLAALANGSLSRLSHAVGRLERDGLVERSACSDGRRRMEARLTDAGLARLEAAAPGHVAEVRRLVIDVLDPGRLEEFGAVARSVMAAIDPTMACAEAGRGSAQQGR